MHKTARLLEGLLRLCGSAALLLGLAFWLGYGRSLTWLHIRLGTAVVALLFVISGLAWRAGAGVRLVALAVGWGILVWFLGMRQGRILPGSFHWVVEVAHLVVGMVAIALGERLATTVKARPSPSVSHAQTAG
jgi:hypothetical protein